MFFTFHTPSVTIVRFLHFEIFSASFLLTYLSPRNYSIYQQHVFSSLSQIIMFYYYYYYCYWVTLAAFQILCFLEDNNLWYM
jgi:hypothetical protein